MEYVGEVLDYEEFCLRTMRYEDNKQSHFYFMALNSDEIIDATDKGNISRFINHSCDPNCETQKVRWTTECVLACHFWNVFRLYWARLLAA